MSFETTEWKELLNTYGHELMGFDLKTLTDEDLDVVRDFGSFGGSLRGIFYDQIEIALMMLEAENKARGQSKPSEYGPEFNTDLKIEIRIRDNNKCMNPQCSGVSKKMRVHHIDYNKKNCIPENLITLCASCNNLANYNRDWWESFYKTIMQKRGIY